MVEAKHAYLLLLLIAVARTNIEMEEERFIALGKLLQHVTYNLHENLSDILTSASAKSGQLGVIRNELKPYFERAWVHLIKLLGLVNWVIDHGKDGLQDLEECNATMSKILSIKSYLINASLDLGKRPVASTEGLLASNLPSRRFDVNTAIDLLSTGMFQRMPMFPYGYRPLGQELNVGPQKEFDAPFVKTTLNDTILKKANSDSGIIWFDNAVVKSGVLILSKKNEFDIELRLADIRASSKWALHSNNCYIAEKKSAALPVKRPPFDEFCRIVDNLVHEAKVTRGLSGNALLFKLRQQFPKWAIDKSYVEDAFLSNKFASVIRNVINDNEAKSSLRDLYMSAHHFCLQQAMKYIYLQVEKKKKLYFLKVAKNAEMTKISIVYFAETVCEGTISCMLIENPFCPEEYELKIWNVRHSASIESIEPEQLCVSLNAIDMYTLIGNIFNRLALQRLDYVYKNVRYFCEHPSCDLQRNALQIKVNSLHEYMTMTLQYDKWSGKMYLRHKIHCEKLLWRKAKDVDSIISACNVELSAAIMPVEQLCSVLNGLFDSLRNTLSDGETDNDTNYTNNSPGKHLKKKRKRT